MAGYEPYVTGLSLMIFIRLTVFSTASEIKIISLQLLNITHMTWHDQIGAGDTVEEEQQCQKSNSRVFFALN